jgi:hypothetical protein
MASAGETTPELSPAKIPAEARLRDDELQARIDAHVAASDRFIARHGSLADEFAVL